MPRGRAPLLLLLATLGCPAYPSAAPAPVPSVPPRQMGLVAAPPRDTTAPLTTLTAATRLPAPAASVYQLVTFSAADDRVTAVCVVVKLTDGTIISLPFADARLAPPMGGPPLPCALPPGTE
jgi:hypothetical protein